MSRGSWVWGKSGLGEVGTRRFSCACQAALVALLLVALEPFEDDPESPTEELESLEAELESLEAELDSLDEEPDLDFSDALARAFAP